VYKDYLQKEGKCIKHLFNPFSYHPIYYYLRHYKLDSYNDLNMKFITILLTAMLLFSLSSAQKKQTENQKSHRIEKVINSQWTFNYFPASGANKGYEAQLYDDSKWPAVSIPHTWSTFETTGLLHPFIRNASETDNPYWWVGWGWYRKHFIVNKEYTGHKYFIEFEGVQKYCKVWINGKYLGDHKGGYGSFDFDITEVLKPGEDNVIAVAVNNKQVDEFKIPPMAAGDFNVYGGICRDVKLVIKDRLFIPMQGSASHEGGTFVTTPKVSEKEGIVRVQTWVKNDYAEKKSCTIQTTIADSANNIIQVLKTDADIDPGELYKFDQTSKPVKNPHLWSNDDPYMYKILTRVMDGKILTDSYSSPLGFRWFSWDYKENNLVVNGKKMIIHGGNRHEEYPWIGNALPKWITAIDLTDIAENMNYNFLRTAHYPNDRSVYDLTDKYGISIDEELPNINNQDFSDEVQLQQLKEMIRRDRNHPSIMFWSLGNETNHAVDSKFALTEDTTRILTARMITGGSAGQSIKHSEKNLDIKSLIRSTIRGWYNKDVKDLQPADGQQSGTEEHQQNILKASGLFGNKNLCTWLYADYGTGHGYLNTPLLNVSPEGYVDIYRVPKYAYYFWQANYSKKLMVFIQPHYWRSQYMGQLKDIVVTTNGDKVELFVNGVSRGYKLLDESNFHSVTFNNVPVDKGTLSAVATKDGKTIRTEIVMAGRPAKIILTGSSNRISADRGSLVIIKADIVDSWGNHVCGANNILKWTVSGPATLVGPSIYESDINRNAQKDGVWYIDMPVSNIIRSTGKPGEIHITISASGLSSGTYDIVAEESVPDNSAIGEPALKDEGRMTIAKMILNSSQVEDVPREINPAFDEFKMGDSDKTGYEKALRDYIKKNNPSVDTTSVEFKTLTDLLADQLLNSGGHLIADDYNFSVDHYNNSRLISGYINSTKLPQPFKDGLKKFYSETIIKKGSDKNAGEEMNWLNWIPSGGTVVIVRNEKPPNGAKGIIYTKNPDLEQIISVVYPQFANFSMEAKERALVFISKANPYIHMSSSGEKSKISYIAETGQPILIPLLKFISE
jgi:beta-galactosidase